METDFVQLMPLDKHNQALRENVHPIDWTNPIASEPYHLVVIGAGTAGLVAAAGAAGLGARVALIERELMGGDCLNVGCVPSKAVIGAARKAAALQNSAEFGIEVTGEVKVDFSSVMSRMRNLRAKISPNDSAERFRELGVDVYFGQGAFENSNTITVTRHDGSVSSLQYRKALIASGARASAPPISGLDSVNYLTNENLFSLREQPRRLGVIGSGPIGSEMAQTFARLGSQVFLFERAGQILPREDNDAAAIVQRQFEQDGVEIICDAHDMKVVAQESNEIEVLVSHHGQEKTTVVDQLLVAVGRAPNTDGLNLENVGVKFDEKGVGVNDYLQTSNPRIYAAGDICSAYKFTHAADFQARMVVQNALFALGPFGRKRSSDLIVPWATYTSPEIAHVGMYADDAGIEIDTYVQDLADVDRAMLEGKDRGFVKVHTRKGSDKIVGATIVAENAGDMISEITVAMKNKIGLAGIGASIHPYPTQAEAIRKLGDQYSRTKLTPVSKKVLDILRRINVGK